MDQINQSINLDKRAPNVFTTSKGVTLKIRPVPSHVTRAVLQTIKEPRIPTWHNEEKSRDEQNPIDPDYLEALDAYKNAQVDLTNRAYLLYTSVINDLPEDIDPYDSEAWSTELELVGVQGIHESGRERYVDWLKFYLLTDADFRDLMTAIYVAGGLVSEEDVKAAVESFPDNKNGAPDINVPVK